MKKRFGRMLAVLLAVCMVCGTAVLLSGCGDEKVINAFCYEALSCLKLLIVL